jgi:hypothetical protein
MRKIPTVSDTVMFFPALDDADCRTNYLKEDEGIPALVTRVWSPDCVNLTVFPDNGVPQCRTSINKAKVFGRAEPFSWNWPEKI